MAPIEDKRNSQLKATFTKPGVQQSVSIACCLIIFGLFPHVSVITSALTVLKNLTHS